MNDTYESVRACSIALLSGAVLQAAGVSVGNGSVVDWRAVKSGETIQSSADAFDSSQLFVALVGPKEASGAANGEPSAVFVPPVPDVTAYMQQANGGRLRAFTAPSGFRVMVEADYDDQEQARFATWLAAKSMEFT